LCIQREPLWFLMQILERKGREGFAKIAETLK